MHFPYRIVHTDNRTSSALFEGNGVLIRLAGRLSAQEEERHIASLLRRMARRFAAHRAARVIDPWNAVLQGNGETQITLADGSVRTFRVTSGKKTSAKRTENGWAVERGFSANDRDMRTFLWRLLSLSERENMERLVRAVNAQTFRARIATVRLRHMSSRYGSCAPGGRITINTALLFIPEHLRTYVIIHELAHILHPNHSAAFWAAIREWMPDYGERRDTLRRYHLHGG